jgi:indolepyruvate ferredoxin oxidoreductase alpha subunit
MLDAADSQEAYDFTRLAFKLSRRWGTIVIVRTTTRISHSNTIVAYDESTREPLPQADYKRDIPSRVMVPGHARPAHRRLRAKLAEIEKWNASEGPNKILDGASNKLGIISSGIAFQHALEAAPDAGFFKVGMCYPLPVEKLIAFTKRYERCIVIEEGDPYITTQLRAAGANLDERPETYRFGEFTVDRALAQIRGDTAETPRPIKTKPPQLCKGCPHFYSFEPLVREDIIVAGDIGCYTLTALKPLQAMDIQICMGASIGIGLGMRHVLPEEQARKVVSVIGDSTFMHSGLPGLVEMVYNPPKTGHVVIVVDNATTAMTGTQENPSTGRKLDRAPTTRVVIEEVARAIGVKNVAVFHPIRQSGEYVAYLKDCLARNELSLIVLRQPCVLAAPMIAKLKSAEAAAAAASASAPDAKSRSV